jgi:hypothetical protein
VLLCSTSLCPTADPVLSTYWSLSWGTDCSALPILPATNRSATLRTTLAFSHMASYEFAFLVWGLVNANSPDSCWYGSVFSKVGIGGLTCRIPGHYSSVIFEGYKVPSFPTRFRSSSVNATVCLVCGSSLCPPYV